VTEPSDILTDSASMASIADQWRALAAGISNSSYFITPDWVTSWYDVFGHSQKVEVAVWRAANGTVEAVVPLVQELHRIHRLLPLGARCPTNMASGFGAADHCGWPVVPSRRGDVRRWLAERSRSGLLLRNLDPDTGLWSVPEDARRLQRTPCPRLRLSGDADSIGSTKFRKKLRWYTRKVASAGITFRWVPAGQVTAGLLDDLLRLHHARANAIDRASSFTDRRREFHELLIKRSTAGCGPSLVLASRDDQIVAALYGFQWNSTFAYYQTGWDPAYAQLSLGTVLVAEAIKVAASNGIEVFDFLRGAEDYKYRFGATDRYDETWLVPRAVGGRLLNIRHRLVSRVQ
jgi:CelD/BcsL family acetyltransferase involved in cellulose biosynthesis